MARKTVSFRSLYLIQDRGYGAHGWLIVTDEWKRFPEDLPDVVWNPYFRDDAVRLLEDRQELQGLLSAAFDGVEGYSVTLA